MCLCVCVCVSHETTYLQVVSPRSCAVVITSTIAKRGIVAVLGTKNDSAQCAKSSLDSLATGAGRPVE